MNRITVKFMDEFGLNLQVEIDQRTIDPDACLDLGSFCKLFIIAR